MNKFTTTHNNLVDFLHDHAAFFQVPVKENRFEYPAPGSGFLEAFDLGDSVTALVGDFTLHRDVIIEKQKTEEEFFSLRFGRLTMSEPLVIIIGKESAPAGQNTRDSVYLTSSLSDFGYVAKKDLRIKLAQINFSRDWLYRQIQADSLNEGLKKYFALGAAAINFEVFDPEYYPYFNALFDPEIPEAARGNVIRNRLLLLLEVFFNRLYNKMHELVTITKEELINTEISRIMEVAAFVVKDVTRDPPTIPQLAEMAAMSTTKLKTMFKKIFGSGIYEYYQANRMNYARMLITSGKYSVKEVGHLLGYDNLSNFSSAFKKQFNLLPSELAES